MDLTDSKKQEILKLKEQKAALLSAAASLEAAIKVLEGNSEKPIDWKNNALDCLRIHIHPLRTIDILNCMAEKDPERYKLNEFIKRRSYVSSLSIALNNLCDKDLLSRIQLPGFKGYFYGLKIWFKTPIILEPEVDERLRYNLWQNPNSVFKLSKLEMDLEKDED